MSKARIFAIHPENKFRLDPAFLAQYLGQQPEWGPIGYVTYKRTYARPLPTGGTEEFWQTCQRVVEGAFSVLCQQVRGFHQRWDEARAQRDAQDMFRRMWTFKFLPPGRGLWFMGTEALEVKGAAALNNCGFVSTESVDEDFSAPFCALMDFSMLGVGMGFDTLGAGRVRIKAPECGMLPYVVEDTREGWIDALRVVLDAFVESPNGVPSYLPPSFDFSQVRPAGAPVSTFGGTASGPEPLRKLLDATVAHLRSRIGQTINSTDIVDLMNRIGVCVVAGNIRRSSEIALGRADDRDFIALKDPAELNALGEALDCETDETARAELGARIGNHPLVTHRWASNNAVLCQPGQVYTDLAWQTVTNGEPGYGWMDTIRAYGRLCDPPNHRDSKAKGFNPCAEQTLWDNELCCLVETFPTNHIDADGWFDELDYRRTLRVAYLYAKIVTLIPTHRPATNAVMSRNRRIGTSMAGVWELYERLGLSGCTAMWDRAYRYIRELDADYSGWMGVPESIKVTSIKPGGTVPLLAGIEGGMKLPIARYYFRTIRIGTDSPLVPALQAAGIRVEPALREPNTVVAYFPVEDHRHKRFAADVSLWEQAVLYTALQRYWADNMVSATLAFRAGEESDVERVLSAYDGQWKAISFLPLDTHSYPQAPYIPVTQPQYEEAVAKLDRNWLAAVLDAVPETVGHEQDDKFCSGGVCEAPVKVA